MALDLKQMKQRLLTLQEELQGRVERTHRHTYDRQEPVSPKFSEQAKQTEDDDLVRTLENEGLEELRQVRKALARLESGDYAYCSRCAEQIGDASLMAIPYTELCIQCANQADAASH